MGPPLRLCENLKHPPQHCRSYPRASLRELESNKFCRHRAAYSPAGTARNVVSSGRGDSKGGHIGVSPCVFFFCHFFLHKQKEMARNLSGIYRRCGNPYPHGGRCFAPAAVRWFEYLQHLKFCLNKSQKSRKNFFTRANCYGKISELVPTSSVLGVPFYPNT